jgi:hypothetical protein
MYFILELPRRTEQAEWPHGTIEHGQRKKKKYAAPISRFSGFFVCFWSQYIGVSFWFGSVRQKY